MIDKEFLGEVEYLLARSEAILRDIKKLKQESCVESATINLLTKNASALIETNLMVRTLFYSLFLDREFSKELLNLAKRVGDRDVANLIERTQKEI